MNANRKKPMPRLASIKPGTGFSVEVSWAGGVHSGKTECIDLKPDIMTYKVYRKLRYDRGLFESLKLADDGTRIVWGEIDMAATSIERLAGEAMTNEDFKRFLSANNLSFDTASAQLGISRRQVAYFSKDKPIPRQIALACRGFEAIRQT